MRRHLSYGITFIEVVIYVALFAILMAVAVLFFLNMSRSAFSVRAEHAAVQNGVLALQAIELETRHAEYVYTPTSVFDSDAGQLSLRTPRLPPADHQFAYVDFYLDNSVVYMKRDDGTNPVALTSGDVNVSALRFERKTSGSQEGIRMVITLSPLHVPSSVALPETIRTFVVPRSFTP